MNAQQLTPPTNDGWSDAAAEAGEHTIRGDILKFADWRWIAGKQQTPVPSGTQLVALAMAMWVRWEGGKPVEYRVREPGGRLPERDELGFGDEAEWEAGPDGKLVDPWRNTRLMYLVHPQTAKAYTFTTSSFGGRRAVSDLGDQIARMRTVHPDAVPVVELDAAEMPTKYGKKSQPVFRIIGWRTAGGTAPIEQKQISARAAEQQVAEREMDDEIPF